MSNNPKDNMHVINGGLTPLDARIQQWCNELMQSRVQARRDFSDRVKKVGILTAIMHRNAPADIVAECIAHCAEAVHLLTVGNSGERLSWTDALDTVTRQLERDLVRNRFDGDGLLSTVKVAVESQRRAVAFFVQRANQLLNGGA